MAPPNNDHQTLGYGLVITDVLWMVVWFALSIWFTVDTGVTDAFREGFRNVIFHNVNTGGLLYVLRFGPSKWGAIVPFVFALLADIEVGLALTITLPTTHAAARALAIAWAWMAVGLSVSSALWFMTTPREGWKK